MFVVQFHPKHRSRQHGLNASFQFQMFFFHSRFTKTLTCEDKTPPPRSAGTQSGKKRGPVNPDLDSHQEPLLVTIASAAATTTTAAAAVFTPTPAASSRAL